MRNEDAEQPIEYDEEDSDEYLQCQDCGLFFLAVKDSLMTQCWDCRWQEYKVTDKEST